MGPHRTCTPTIRGVGRAAQGQAALTALTDEIVACRACPRLVEWRERVAHEKRAAFRDEQYWGRPVPGFGDPAARVLVVGLAPAAHGGNRTGRIFTGDRSGDWLFGALHRTGYASQATSVRADDGLELRDAYVAAAVRCAPPANKPTPSERDRCLPYLVRELALLERVRVIVVLGKFAYDATARVLAESGSPLPSPPRGRSCSAATTPASRTRSRASSPSRCSTTCSRERVRSPGPRRRARGSRRLRRRARSSRGRSRPSAASRARWSGWPGARRAERRGSPRSPTGSRTPSRCCRVRRG